MNKKKFQRLNRSSLSKKEQALFAERLSLLLGASMSLPESIAIMRRAFGKRRHAAFIELENALNHGSSFESALSGSSLGFSRMIILAARIGERSGTLSESLVAAAGRIERGRAIQSAVISAMTYPGIIFFASTAIIAFLVFFIMPKIVPTIESLHVPLPAVTVFFISVSHFLAGEWWKILLQCICIAAIFIFLYKKSIRFQRIIQRVVLVAPLASGIIRAHMLSDMFDTVSTLVSAGCPLIEAVTESSASTGFVLYREALLEAAKGMQSGSNLSTTMRHHPKLFPELSVDSVAIGERTGNMEAVLPQMGRYYARELQSALTGFSKLIEPALMISVGVIVGAAALSIVLPIYEISQHLSG